MPSRRAIGKLRSRKIWIMWIICGRKIREALATPASHRLQLSPPVPTACQLFSGVTPEVRLTSSRRPRARAFESATLAGGLAPPERFVPHTIRVRNPETSFARNRDNVDNYVWIRPVGLRRATNRCSSRRNSGAEWSAVFPCRGEPVHRAAAALHRGRRKMRQSRFSPPRGPFRFFRCRDSVPVPSPATLWHREPRASKRGALASRWPRGGPHQPV